MIFSQLLVKYPRNHKSYKPLRGLKMIRMYHAVYTGDLDPALDIDVVLPKVYSADGDVGPSHYWSHRRLKLTKK